MSPFFNQVSYENVGGEKAEHCRAKRPENSVFIRDRDHVRAVRIGKEDRAEHKRHGEAREQISNHRLVGAHPRLREQHARVMRVLRTQQV